MLSIDIHERLSILVVKELHDRRVRHDRRQRFHARSAGELGDENTITLELREEVGESYADGDVAHEDSSAETDVFGCWEVSDFV